MVLKAVLFDLGGTLVDFDDNGLQSSRKALYEFLVQKQYAVLPDRVVQIAKEVWETYTLFADQTMIELNFPRLMQSILYQLQIDDYPETALIEDAIKAFYSPIIEGSYLLQGASQLLLTLQENGLKLGLVTDNESEVFHNGLLSKYNFEHMFDSIVVSYKLGIKKPHKTMFLKCLEELHINSAEALFIGDKPIHDISGAKNIGLPCVWMKRKEYIHVPIAPDWTIESIQQLEDLLFTKLL
jgi:HAD superfamily hydrolase (TIGR01509 family)